MKWRHLVLPFMGLGAMPAATIGQPADLPIPAATTSEYPTGVAVAETPDGPVYVESRGRTLYGMDMRTVLRWAPDPARYCEKRCEEWEPLLAPAGVQANIVYPTGFGGRRQEAQKELREKGYYDDPQKAPDWTVIEGPHGLQWVYKGWHMVYTRTGDPPASTKHEGAEGMTWNTLKFVPPIPKIVAPSTVSTALVDGTYVYTSNGGLLFTGACGKSCRSWNPLAAGMASRGLGDWMVDRSGHIAQWSYRGKPVFVGASLNPQEIPAGATILRH